MTTGTILGIATFVKLEKTSKKYKWPPYSSFDLPPYSSKKSRDPPYSLHPI